METKLSLLSAIILAFQNVRHPKEYDFKKAIAHYDYEDYQGGSETKWYDVNSADLTSYSEIIHFFEDEAAQYYLQSYLVNLLEFNELFEQSCFDSLMSFLLDADLNFYDDYQKSAIIKFLVFSESMASRFDLDSDDIAQVLVRWKRKELKTE